MYTFTLLSILSLSSFALANHEPDHRRLHRALVERQGQGRPNMNNSWSEPPVSASSSTVSLPASSSSAIASSTAESSSSFRPAESSSAIVASSSATTPPISSSASPVPESSSSLIPSSSVESSSSSMAQTSQVQPTGGVSTISVPSSSATVPPTSLSSISSITRTSITSVVTVSKTASSASGSASAAGAGSESSSSGLSKPALIGIIVGASVVGIAAIAFTLFRKWKLRPSKRFEKRLNAIDFAPKGGDHGEDFFEKSHNRSASASSAERHRKALMAEEFESGPALTAGIPDHDFTATSVYGMAGAGAGAAGMYNSDPFAHSNGYDYGSYGDNNAGGGGEHGYPPQTYDSYGHPVAAQAYELPTQDQEYAHGQGGGGYADLQRGNSDGSAHQHSHTQHSPAQQNYHADMDFPESGAYLGRPTGGTDGPYAQAAQYRAY